MIRTLAAALATTTCIIALATPAMAQTREFNIPAGSLRTALDTYARQSGRQVIYGGDVRSARSPGVRGARTADDALNALLAGTGFVVKQDRSGALAIVKGGNGQAAESSSSSSVANGTVGGADATEIVVTAQKRSERLIATPQSVSVVSTGLLQRQGATQLRDFAADVPGLSYSTAGAGFSQVSLRGVTAGVRDVSSTVGIYVDDVPFGSSSAFSRGAQVTLDVGLFDLDRIEVLRGPQGTLYGASTMGGLLKYVTRRPEAGGFGFEGQAALSDTHQGGTSYNAAGAVNVPLGEQAAVRATGFYSRDGGFVDNIQLGQRDVNRSEVYGGRLDALFTPADRLTIRLGGFLQNISRDGTAAVDYNFNRSPRDGALNQRRRLAEPFDQRFRLASGTLAYDFGGAQLTSISSYQTLRTEYLIDFSAFYVPALAALGPFGAVGVQQFLDTKKFTQEVRLSSSGTGMLEWIVGGFYTHESQQNRQPFVVRNVAGQPIPNTLFDVSVPSTFEEYAAFGDLTVHLTDKFDVSGGVRIARNRQRSTQIGSGLLGRSTPTRTATDTVDTYLANARYRFSPNATLYARFATGYRPGGPNFVANDPVTGQPLAATTFEADTLKSYELGFKGETADRSFGIDLAGYYIDWNNVQINVVRNGFGVIGNAPGGASIRGGELSLTARPTHGFVVVGGFAYQDAKLDAADPDLKAAKGERLPNVPRFTASVNADYSFDAGGTRPTLGATLRFVSDRTTSFNANTSNPQYRLPDYVTLDLRAGIEIAPVTLSVYARNLFDERGQLTAYTGLSTLGGPVQVTLVQPRTIGISASTRF